ncbi:YjbH domain-containing protein [uncultured Roseovarius sp.]|uniref:YjbH domain-containing protein n=1 Tax=uncultured Roseovarius sp. TaxID=293344 RepID=UPI00260E1E14|nr:YjbH domain-containing protein [uncultured Roseovarius sp.]
MMCRLPKVFVALSLMGGATGAFADDLTTTITNNYGTPGGLLDMPTAEMAPDAQLSSTIAYFDGFSKTTLSFQLAPWFTASFRYAGTDDLSPNFSTFYDRSFDVRLRLFEETDFSPAIAVGLQDFVGTGVLSAEYLVATKSFRNLRVTGGLGWGRLGTRNSFGGVGSRTAFNAGDTGGDINIDNWFQGDIGVFAGFSYDFNEKLSFAMEYSSDGYEEEQAAGIFDRSTAVNLGITYRLGDQASLRGYLLHGEEVGVNLNFAINPRNMPVPGGMEPAPLPVAVRDPDAARDLGWQNSPDTRSKITNSLDQTLDRDRIDLVGLRLDGRAAYVGIQNETYDQTSQALGRTARVLTRVLPASVEDFHITLYTKSMPASTVSFRRTDIERLEHRAADQALAAATFSDSLRFGDLPDPLPGKFPRYGWGITPFTRISLFDPDNPARIDVALRFQAQAELGRGWVARGATSIKLFGNLDETTRVSTSRLPRVRSDAALYAQEDGPRLDWLTLTKYLRIAPDVYARGTVGYLEQMYAGASTEVLWRPVDSRLAIGAELNYVRPRDFDSGFGLRSSQTVSGEIPDFNGHASVYYDFGGGFHGQLDAGRYLAGDWGVTVALDREFANGWKVGAFATKTDVSAQDFGEGSFDKGIRITAPLSWILGKPTQQAPTAIIRSLTRDGGQRLNVSGRLYETVRPSHKREAAASWGKFWR